MSDAEIMPTESPPEAADAPTERPQRPPYLPEKFWDDAKGSARVEALAKSYSELERKLGSRGMAAAAGETAPAGVVAGAETADPATPPEPATAYRIAAPHPLVSQDGEVDARLLAAGFSEQQAQLVYDLAAERLLPLVGEAVGELEAQRQLDRLERYFGGEEAWRETARQIKGWAAAHLPDDVAATLAGSADGVLALHQMMRASEPELAGGGADAGAEITETSLAEMMRDRRYWQQRDPEFIARVTQGFKKLYAG
jgi:hypothetical protein